MTILQNYINNIHDYRYDPQAIAEYQFPPAMSAKLMQEQKWSAEYTGRVLAEYRRFIHLAATAGHEVTPSQIVDEAWHMHLTFSRDYWEKLVPLLPAPLHHEPAQGQPGDTAKYADQYRRTLADYRAAFMEDAPADIWPTPQSSRPHRTRRKNNWPAALGISLSAGAVLLGLKFSVPLVLTVVVVLCLLVNQFAGAWAAGSGGGGGSCGGASCGFTGGDSCDVGGDGGCGDSGGGDGGGGDGGSCGGGCGGGCGS